MLLRAEWREGEGVIPPLQEEGVACGGVERESISESSLGETAASDLKKSQIDNNG